MLNSVLRKVFCTDEVCLSQYDTSTIKDCVRAPARDTDALAETTDVV